jgi:hypothetical protein
MRFLILLLISMAWSGMALADCSAEYYYDYEQYDFSTRTDADNWCSGIGSQFSISDWQSSCFVNQRRINGGWGQADYRYDAVFRHRGGQWSGRGQWDVFNGFESDFWYTVYQGFVVSVRIVFPDRCDDYSGGSSGGSY